MVRKASKFGLGPPGEARRAGVSGAHARAWAGPRASAIEGLTPRYFEPSRSPRAALGRRDRGRRPSQRLVPERAAAADRSTPSLGPPPLDTHERLGPCRPIRAAAGGRPLWCRPRESGGGPAEASAVENQGAWSRTGLTVGGGVAAPARPTGPEDPFGASLCVSPQAPSVEAVSVLEAAALAHRQGEPRGGRPNCLHAATPALGEVVDAYGWTRHPGPPRPLAQWRLGGCASKGLGVETSASNPGAYDEAHAAWAAGGIAAWEWSDHTHWTRAGPQRCLAQARWRL